MDFTFSIYEKLLNSLNLKGYHFSTFEGFVKNPNQHKMIVLRHDVDRKPLNALKMAKIENKFGVKSSYFFRVVDHVWKEDIIKEVANLGHEVAYHYEDLTITKGDMQKAIQHFEYWLNRIREFYPSKTICMHGSPISKWDNRSLWKEYDYKKFGIIAEPYFDVDYNDIFYLTDTGRSWNNREISVRDHVVSNIIIPINSTNHMIQMLEEKRFPSKVMINTHPHRWSSNIIEWSSEYVLQNLKNQIKRMIVRKNEK